MKIHIISTANGQQNEGMRNVATHLIDEISKKHSVYASGLKSFLSIIKNSIICDTTIFCARLNSTTYGLLKVITALSKNVDVVVVQQPDVNFIDKNNKSPLKCDYHTLCMEDMYGIKICKGRTVSVMEIGIDCEKFSPISNLERNKLKEKYGISNSKPLVIHVGHCSAGRGLEDFCLIDSDKFERLVITSGMFEDRDVSQRLAESGVTRLSGYIENINDYYRMADAYFFPTRSGDFVISIPLSVMEALACGTVSVAYRSFDKLKNINYKDDGLILIENDEKLNEALMRAVQNKRDISYLETPKSWAGVAEQMLEKSKNKDSVL